MKNDCEYSVIHFDLMMNTNFLQIQTFRDVLIIFTTINLRQTDIPSFKNE